MANAAVVRPVTPGDAGPLHANPSVAVLYEHALRRGEGRLAANGQFLAYTGRHTERSPEDKFIVREPGSEHAIDWNEHNRPVEPEVFDALFERVDAYLASRERYQFDTYLCASGPERIGLRIVSDLAWHGLFARNLFVAAEDAARDYAPDVTILDAANFLADPVRDGTRSETFVLLHFGRRLVLIGGTHFAGELKKAAFTIVNYLAPLRDALPMHCSANSGKDGATALFFGVSGSGKTTLGADPERSLIGDDEHLWSASGITNVEAGCYACALELDASCAPAIWDATHRFGTVLENVVCDPDTRILQLTNGELSDNTRSAYPVRFVRGAHGTGSAAHPRAIVILCCDAFGVLPRIARLTAEQAAYHFLCGFGSEPAAAGTDREPVATFSSCFGAAFMVHRPAVYAKLFVDRIARHDVACWLVNTGWSGGPAGGGTRIAITQTRAAIAAALAGQLDDVPFEREAAFGLAVPRDVSGLTGGMLDARSAWPDPAAYDRQAAALARYFAEHFATIAP